MSSLQYEWGENYAKKHLQLVKQTYICILVNWKWTSFLSCLPILVLYHIFYSVIHSHIRSYTDGRDLGCHLHIRRGDTIHRMLIKYLVWYQTQYNNVPEIHSPMLSSGSSDPTCPPSDSYISIWVQTPVSEMISPFTGKWVTCNTCVSHDDTTLLSIFLFLHHSYSDYLVLVILFKCW